MTQHTERMKIVIINAVKGKMKEIEKVYCQKNKYTPKHGPLEKAKHLARLIIKNIKDKYTMFPRK